MGLDVGTEQTLGDPAWNGLLGLDKGTTARAIDVAVGQKILKLVAFDPQGAPYPAQRASNDQWFEHVALVTGDIIKGSLSIDPDGFPLLYTGSRDNKTRIVALDSEPVETLWSIDSKDYRSEENTYEIQLH